MTLRLDKIFFNHPDTTRTGAITIRQNGTEDVPLPEWQFKGAAPKQPTPIAYRCDKVPSTIIIKASFHRDDDDRNDLEIQAVASVDDHLGNVSARRVTFNANGDSDLVPFEVPGHRITARGVDVTTTEWRWQYRASEQDQYVDFDRSSHTVYSIFGEPTAPWDGELPWAEVLDYACEWARGAQNEVMAATRITERMYRLGDEGKVSYTEGAAYARKKFDCTAFLDLLNGKVGNGPLIDCDDCATVTSTFSNILGGDLFQSDMGYNFHTNLVRKIGQSTFACTGFPKHAVAWKSPCEAGSVLYDACLEIDKHGQLGSGQSAEPLLAANLAFGSGSQRNGDYKFCLVRVLKGELCDPKPRTKARRQLGKSYFGSRRFDDQDYLALLKETYSFESWPSEEAFSELTRAISIEDLLSSPIFQGWDVKTIDSETDTDLTVVNSILLLRPANDPVEMVDLNLYQSAPPYSPNDLLLQLLAQFERNDFERQAEGDLGDISFVAPEATQAVFRRGKFSSVIRSVGKSPIATTDFAERVDKYFKELYQPPG